MTKTKRGPELPEEMIIRNIILVRNERVILDVHLAAMYGVETRVLKQAVRRNIERFPADFMFELTDKEMAMVIVADDPGVRKKLGGARSFAFTEVGVAMLSSVLNSDAAIKMNISIMRTFIKLRRLATNYDELLKALQQMKLEYDGRFEEIFDALDVLIGIPASVRQPIGFKKG